MASSTAMTYALSVTSLGIFMKMTAPPIITASRQHTPPIKIARNFLLCMSNFGFAGEVPALPVLAAGCTAGLDTDADAVCTCTAVPEAFASGCKTAPGAFGVSVEAVTRIGMGCAGVSCACTGVPCIGIGTASFSCVEDSDVTGPETIAADSAG